jgi:hypothetical protein
VQIDRPCDLAVEHAFVGVTDVQLGLGPGDPDTAQALSIWCLAAEIAACTARAAPALFAVLPGGCPTKRLMARRLSAVS